MAEMKSFDRVADVYDQTRGLPPAAEREIAAGIARELRTVAAVPRLLEVGIGTGRIAAPLAAEGVRVTGIDIAPKMLARLREKRGSLRPHPPPRARRRGGVPSDAAAAAARRARAVRRR